MTRRFPSTLIDRLLDERKLERLTISDRNTADELMDDARNHLASVELLLENDSQDLNGMLALAYDAAAKPLRAVLVNQGLKAKGGEGAHKTVIVAVEDQLKASGLPVRKVSDVLRLRNGGEYGNEWQGPVTREDIEEAAALAKQLIEGVEKVLDHMFPY